MHIVVIPCFDRPTMLQVCLEQIQKADGADRLFYVFAKDFGYSNGIDRVIKSFPFNHRSINTPKTNYKTGKQSFNVLNALMAASLHSEGLVYLIEDDIFIGRDFFTYHWEVLFLEPDLFCSIGTRNNNTRFVTTDDESAYYISSNGDYQSLGVCYKKEVIKNNIYPHFNANYFRDPRRYVERYFSGSKIGNEYCEQDGLIRRIIERDGGRVAFPHVPRAFHGGFFGMNRGGKAKHYSAADIRRIAFDVNQLREVVIDPYFVFDSEPCRLDTSFNDLHYLEATF